MNIPDRKSIRLAYDYSLIAHRMIKEIIPWLPINFRRDLVVVCIGTDRSTGDALGPLTGTTLEKRPLNNLFVYGTLHYPIHALNLEQELDDIYQRHHNPFIIAVDACLGRAKSVGDIIAGYGSIKPGAAVNKQLPDVGDMYLTGVINVSGFLEYTVLQSTRLSLVVDMANTIAKIIYAIDRNISLGEYSNTTRNNIL